MKKLLDTLADYRHDTDGWPRSPRGLGDALKRQSPALAVLGISVEFDGKTRDGFTVTIKKYPPLDEKIQNNIHKRHDDVNIVNVVNMETKLFPPGRKYTPKLSGLNEGEI